MGLEIAFSIRSGRDDTEIKSRGDILCVKLENSPWGSMELKTLAIIRITNAVWNQMPDSAPKRVLEHIWNKLIAKQNAGELYPVLTLPTAHYATKTVGGRVNTKLVRRSRRYADFSAVPLALKNRWLDINDSVPVQTPTLAQLADLFKVRSNPTVEIDETLTLSEDDE